MSSHKQALFSLPWFIFPLTALPVSLILGFPSSLKAQPCSLGKLPGVGGFVPLLHKGELGGGNSEAFSRSDPQVPLLVVYRVRDRATASLLTASHEGQQLINLCSRPPRHFLLKQNKNPI